MDANTTLPPQIQIPPFCMGRNMKQNTVGWLWPEVCWVWQQGQSKRPKDLRCYRCLIDTSNSIYLDLELNFPLTSVLAAFPTLIAEVKNLGTILSAFLSLTPHIYSFRKIYWLYLQNVSKSDCLPPPLQVSQVYNTFISCLDYCNCF